MGEAKQLPRIAGPTVAVMGSGTKGSGFHHPFVGNIVPSIVPMYTPYNFRRPGDVYKPSSSKSSSRQAPRPLGLIPDRREHVDDLPRRFTGTLLAQSSNGRSTGHVDSNSRSILPVKPSTAPANRLKPLNMQYRTKSALTIGENVQPSATKSLSIVHEDSDPDYMDILGRLNEPHYLQSVPEHVSYQYVHDDGYSQKRHSVCLPVKSDKQRKQPPHNRRRAYSLKPNMEVYDDVRYHTARPSAAHYINFVEQASIYQKQFDTDKRDGLDYIPCERCRLRGGRCSNCKTIRIGGGYIILDGDNDNSETRGDHSRLNTTLDPDDGHLAMLTDRNQLGGHGTHNGDLTHGGRLHQHNGDSDDERRRRGQDDGKDGKSGRNDGSDGFGNGTRGHDNGDMHNSRTAMGYDGKMAGHGLSGSANNSSGLGNGLGNTSNRPGVGLSQNKSGTGGNRGDSNDDLTDGLDRVKSSHSNTSRPGSSRPVSSRPASRIGSGVGGRRGGYERKNRKGGSTSMEKQSGGRRKKRSGDGDSSSDSDDDEAKRRRRKKDSGLPEIDENASSKDKANKKKRNAKDFNLTGHYSGEDSEPEQKLKYRGSLYKFKSKEDNVKALKCTLKELQGIDPLDYLAKYCIIDQSKLPNYRRVYDNVNRDEDDEIDITELDFALKAVNYDLISDAEVDYVNQILELSSRYKLNFHLFSVIAALSEKVVSLEDMVKKLINKMDLKALETKMKKCKELFYLLDDMDSGERDGVVTVASLAVELQAGGLTEEHVEFVVDRLNHEQKGLVEFLDYLTYVPLFVEIHDSVCGNPLDFSRTK